MKIIKNAESITELSDRLTSALVFGKADQIDLITSADTQFHDVMAHSESCAYDFDLKQVWVTKSRWTSLVRQYIDPEALETWLSLCEDKLVGRKRGVSFMRTNMVKGKRNATTGREWRRWGSCMLGVGYRALPRPQITLHSRTTYLGYIGQIDLALVAVLAREVGERVGLDPEDIGFTWHLEMGAFHGFKSLAWFWQNEEWRDRLLEYDLETDGREYPTLYLAKKQYNYFMKADQEGMLYGEMAFAQHARLRRRIHGETMPAGYGEQFNGGDKHEGCIRRAAGPLPSVPLSKLNLDPVRKIQEGDDTLAGYSDEHKDVDLDMMKDEE